VADTTVADAPPAPYREAHLMPVDLDVERRADGTVLITSKIPLRPYDANIPAAFARRAVFLAQALAQLRQQGVVRDERQVVDVDLVRLPLAARRAHRDERSAR